MSGFRELENRKKKKDRHRQETKKLQAETRQDKTR